MKKLLIPLLFLSGFFAIYEQSKDQPNIFATIAGVAVFFFGMMQLSAKTPSKNQEKEEDEFQ